MFPQKSSISLTKVLTTISPISDIWTVSFTPQHCVDNKIHLLVQGILNIIADFLVVLIPIPIVLKLKLPMRQRVIVALLFGAGFIVCFAGIARTVYMYRLTETYYDVTWDAFPVWLSTAVELYIGIVRIFLFSFFPLRRKRLTVLLICTFLDILSAQCLILTYHSLRRCAPPPHLQNHFLHAIFPSLSPPLPSTHMVAASGAGRRHSPPRKTLYS